MHKLKHKFSVKTPLNHSNSRLANQDKINERENWHKLVVKIISWKDARNYEGSIRTSNKITPKEWKTYSKRMIETNVTYGKQKVMENLKEIQRIIQQNGGFENPDA